MALKKTFEIKFTLVPPPSPFPKEKKGIFAWLRGNEICPLKKLKIHWISRGGGFEKNI